MKIHLRQLEAGQTHFAGQIEQDVYQLDDKTVVPRGGYEYEVEAGQQGQSVWVTGRVAASFDLRCVNCLEMFEYRVEVPEFAAQQDVEGPEILDLTDEVREDILLALPTHPKCDVDGDVVCPGRILAANHAPEKAPQERASSSDSSWDALNQLDID